MKACGLGVFGVGHRGEGFGKSIPPLANRLTFAGDVEPHPLVSRVEAVLVDEVDAVSAKFQPFVALFDGGRSLGNADSVGDERPPARFPLATLASLGTGLGQEFA